MNPAPDKLILALPSKGRLHDLALIFLKGAGFDALRSKNDRSYGAKLAGAENIDVVFFRPDEIPARIEQGDAHIGITGEDLYREVAEGPPLSTLLMTKLGFGAARLVVAVPQSWIDVSTMADLEEAATLFHQKHGKSLRVATSFPRLARAFLADAGIVEYCLVESLGATEGTPRAGIADIIVDLTSTGATLVENHLKEISDGTVVDSEARIVASLGRAIWTNNRLGALRQLVEQIESRQRAISTLMLRFSIPSDWTRAALNELRVRFGCAIASWIPAPSFDSDDTGVREDFISALCDREQLYSAASYLRSCGSSEIVATRSEFIFEGASPTLTRFEQLLRHEAHGERGNDQ
jgi:ATP phosphoribosyltransferase